jgi:hypothetical protein
VGCNLAGAWISGASLCPNLIKAGLSGEVAVTLGLWLLQGFDVLEVAEFSLGVFESCSRSFNDWALAGLFDEDRVEVLVEKVVGHIGEKILVEDKVVVDLSVALDDALVS